MGPLEKNLIEHFDERVAELFDLALEDVRCEEIKTEEDLLQYELSCNSIGGKPMEGYQYDPQIGAILTDEMIKQRCGYIWTNYLFIESTGMNYRSMEQFIRLQKMELDPAERLFWPFRLCRWGSMDVVYPYTLYKGLITGRFEPYYDSDKMSCFDFSRAYNSEWDI